jgi:hypothetical protein
MFAKRYSLFGNSHENWLGEIDPRAQALLIIIGDPYLLWLDDHWRHLVQYCIEYGGYSGCRIDTKTGKAPIRK